MTTRAGARSVAAVMRLDSSGGTAPRAAMRTSIGPRSAASAADLAALVAMGPRAAPNPGPAVPGLHRSARPSHFPPEAGEEIIRPWADHDRDDAVERGVDVYAYLADVAAARDRLRSTGRVLAESFVRVCREAAGDLAHR